jgi:putative hydrolase of the HAD superfamily
MSRTVLFDWFGVICRNGAHSQVLDRLSTSLNVSRDKLSPLVSQETSRLKLGGITVDEFWRNLEKSLNMRIVDDYRQVWTDINDARPDQSMIDFVDQLRNKGYTVAVLSNTFPFTASEIKSMGWYDSFSNYFLSSDIGIAKPDSRAYDYALEQLSCKAEEVIYIDDQQKCLTPAKELGMTTILATSPEQVKRDILIALSSH